MHTKNLETVEIIGYQVVIGSIFFSAFVMCSQPKKKISDRRFLMNT